MHCVSERVGNKLVMLNIETSIKVKKFITPGFRIRDETIWILW